MRLSSSNRFLNYEVTGKIVATSGIFEINRQKHLKANITVVREYFWISIFYSNYINILKLKMFDFPQCVIGEGRYGCLVIMKEGPTITQVKESEDCELKMTIRYFFKQNGVIKTNESSEIEIDNEVTI